MTDRERIAELERRLLIEGIALGTAIEWIAGLRVDRALEVLMQARARITAEADAVQAARESKRAA